MSTVFFHRLQNGFRLEAGGFKGRPRDVALLGVLGYANYTVTAQYVNSNLYPFLFCFLLFLFLFFSFFLWVFSELVNKVGLLWD
jgi:hypothetical protein